MSNYRSVIASSGVYDSNALVLLVNTESVGTTTDVTLSFIGTANTSFTIDWNDGNSNVITHDGNTQTIIHDYGVAGQQYINIYGDVGQIVTGNSNNTQLLELVNYGNAVILTSNQEYTFAEATSMKISATDYPLFVANTATDGYYKNCSSMVKTSSNQWDANVTANIIDMRNMFEGANSFIGTEITNWNTSNVTNMGSMFQGASNFNADIGGWNVSNVTDMTYAFRDATAFNGNISNWTLSNGFLQNGLEGMFWGATSFNQDISSWVLPTSGGTYLSRMFQGASSFNANIAGWDVTRLVSTQSMFDGATSFNQDLSSWDITNWSNTHNGFYMFNNCGLSTENWSRTLIGWANQVSNNGGTPNAINLGAATGLTYSNTVYGGSPYDNAVDARNYLTSTLSWTITGDSQV